MGARNVGAAYLMWSHLPDGPFRVLLGMALRSLDDDGPAGKARRWYGGEDDLIGFVRQTNGAGKVRTRAARRSAAYRYLEQLRDAGAVSIATSGARTRRAVYTVNVDPMGPTPSDPNVSDAVGREGSDAVGREGSDAVGPLGTTEEPRRKNDEENIAFLHHSQTREASAGDEQEISQHYDGATDFLRRTIGTGPAGDETATWLLEHPDTGYMTAVVSVAEQRGWSP